MRVEDEYMDVLQNIEVGVVDTYQDHPEMSDHDVLRVFEAVMDVYKAERVGREPRHAPFTPAEADLFETVRATCDWRLGRDSALSVDEPEGAPVPTITVDEVLLCLKRLVKSVKTWSKEGGRRGYLDFIVQYV